MLTASANGANDAPMWSISQIAERDRVSKPTVSIHVKRLVERHGLAVERDGRGRVARVNVAEYDVLRNRFADPSKAQAPEALPGPLYEAKDSYDEALRRKTLYEAERRRIELDQLKGKLIGSGDVADALDRACNVSKEALGDIEEATDDLAAAFNRDGVRGLRAALRRLGDQVAKRQTEAFSTEARRLRDAIHDDVREGNDTRQ